jgi:hypothetical protein
MLARSKASEIRRDAVSVVAVLVAVHRRSQETAWVHLSSSGLSRTAADGGGADSLIRGSRAKSGGRGRVSCWALLERTLLPEARHCSVQLQLSRTGGHPA